MNKTKEKILSKSIILFNGKGVQKTTTRHIAEALGISQGNLHYHLSSREDILKELYSLFEMEIGQAQLSQGKEGLTREKVLESMHENYRIMYKYRFLFLDTRLIWTKVPIVRRKMRRLFKQKQEDIYMLIKLYQQNGVIRNDISELQMQNLADQFILVISSWINSASFLEVRPSNIMYYAKFTFRLWLPYLTTKELLAWEAILATEN